MSLSVEEPEKLPFREDYEWRLTAPPDLKLLLAYTKGGERLRRSLSPGDSIDLGHGIFTYEETRPWQKFVVDYDPSRMILAIFSFIAIGGITVHYALPRRELKARPAKKERPSSAL